MDSLETLSYIQEHGGSFVRFGDGELDIIFGNGSPNYQESVPMLAVNLQHILTQPQPNLLICIPEVFNLNQLTHLSTESEYFWKRFLVKNKSQLSKITIPQYKYGSSQITRPYLRQKNKSVSGHIFQLFKSLLTNRDLVIVEGERTRFGVGNDLVVSASSVKRILGPSKNAFKYIDSILHECLKQSRTSLFLVALGPAAKVLISRLVEHGYQAYDVGHLDIEYEHYLHHKDQIGNIPGKWSNEAPICFQEGEFDKAKYYSEVIAKVPGKNYE